MTYCGDHFTVNTNIKSLCYTPETNMLYVNCTSKEKKRENKDEQRTDWWLPEVEKGYGQAVGEMGEDSQKMPTSSYRINKS